MGAVAGVDRERQADIACHAGIRRTRRNIQACRTVADDLAAQDAFGAGDLRGLIGHLAQRHDPGAIGDERHDQHKKTRQGDHAVRPAHEIGSPLRSDPRRGCCDRAITGPLHSVTGSSSEGW